ncbi:MAG: hypothetical protein ACK5L3_06540 [Oscillospiraceae bacterium]
MENPKKVTWCENWIKAIFAKLPEDKTGIERNLLFEMATKAGLYTPNTYGTALSKALTNLGIKCDSVCNENGEFVYNAFRLPV